MTHAGDWSIFRLGDVFVDKSLAENMDLSPSVAPGNDRVTRLNVTRPEDGAALMDRS